VIARVVKEEGLGADSGVFLALSIIVKGYGTNGRVSTGI
jgi:hypothetical protein